MIASASEDRFVDLKMLAWSVKREDMGRGSATISNRVVRTTTPSMNITDGELTSMRDGDVTFPEPDHPICDRYQ